MCDEMYTVAPIDPLILQGKNPLNALPAVTGEM